MSATYSYQNVDRTAAHAMAAASRGHFADWTFAATKATKPQFSSEPPDA